MDVTLYRVTDQPNKVVKNLKKVKELSDVRFIEKDALDILNPTILFKNTTEIADNSKYNYFKIAKFNRYYFITSITAEGGLVRVTGKCDVLMSHSADILASQQYVLRQESKYKNPYLFDNLLPITSDHNYIGKPFGNPVFKKDCGYVLLATTGIGGRIVPN